MSKKLFSKEELKRIEEAVKEAEASSDGEIVPVFARQSSFYEMALWRGGFGLAVIVSLILLIINEMTDLLLFVPPYLWVIMVFFSGITGAALVMQIASLKRLVVGKNILRARVEDQAQNMFYQHNVSFTEQRTGILLYISFFEKMAVVLPDIGIAEVVDEDAWSKLIHNLTTQLKQGNAIEGITGAIKECGLLVENSHIQEAKDDGNELSDEVRFNG